MLACLATQQQLPGGGESGPVVSLAAYRACIARAIHACDLSYLLGDSNGGAATTDEEWLCPYTRSRLRSAIARVVDQTQAASMNDLDGIVAAAICALDENNGEAARESIDRWTTTRPMKAWLKEHHIGSRGARQLQGAQTWQFLVTRPSLVRYVTALTPPAAHAAAAAAAAAAAPTVAACSGEPAGPSGAPSVAPFAAPAAAPPADAAAPADAAPADAHEAADDAAGMGGSGGAASGDADLHFTGPAWVIKSTLLEQERTPVQWESEAASQLNVSSLLQGKELTHSIHFYGRPEAVTVHGQLVGPFDLTEVHCAPRNCNGSTAPCMAPQPPAAACLAPCSLLLAPCFCSLPFAGEPCHRGEAHQQEGTAALLHRPEARRRCHCIQMRRLPAQWSCCWNAACLVAAWDRELRGGSLGCGWGGRHHVPLDV